MGLGDSLEDLAFAQITPSGQDVASGNSIESTKAAAPITPSEQTPSGSEATQNSDQKYAASVDPATENGETLLDKIFSKVNRDLQASGITALGP